MKLQLDLVGHRPYRGAVIGHVRVRGDGQQIFADSVNLSTAKGRAAFIRALKGQLNGTSPDDAALERELLGMLHDIEAGRATIPTTTRPAVPGEERIED